MSFSEFKAELADRAREFVVGSGRCRELISEGMTDFIRDGSVSPDGAFARDEDES
jgi:translation initiation factor eIF-2B subunit alpha